MEFEITTAVITALVIGLVKVATELGLPKRFAPLAAIVLGLVSTIVVAFFTVSATVIFTGLAIGLSAIGLYSGVKNTIQK